MPLILVTRIKATQASPASTCCVPYQIQSYWLDVETGLARHLLRDAPVHASAAGTRVTASLSTAVNAAAVAERPATAAPLAIDTTKTPKQLGFTMPGV